MILTQSGVSLRLKHHDQFQSGLASRTRLGFERFIAGTNGDLFFFCVFPVAEVEGFRSCGLCMNADGRLAERLT